MKDELNSEYNEERWAAAHRRGNFLTATCIVLAGAIVGLVWYAYPLLKDRDSSFHDLPSLTQRLTHAVNSIGDRLREAEAKAADTSNAQASLRDQMTDLGRNLRARIEKAGQQASQSAEDTYHKLQAEIRTQTEGLAQVTERVSGLESGREKDQAQFAQFQQTLNQVREQADARAVQQSADLAQVRGQMEESRTGAGEQIAALQSDEDRDRRDIDAVTDQVAVRKIPFEATKNHSRDLGEGIFLYIDTTDPTYRQVSGRVWVTSDRRNLWLHNQSVQEPVIFYGYQDGQKRELVITNVTTNSVTGYLLLPKG
jgi:hypothetical protein